ncbi:Uncharacterised protein [Mycolicibacterium vanbaalenii]|uniref:Polyketide cyclase / dehydrase and lipid transport n=1 Tax=Mycolicibacterium vanbaalenii TaxID=110539 RepID=A0A5S9MS06_MYCVN|nr:SRPBCC family protein [Mycolicibacterium vanbaalenii]CAA0078947.1 Uncharacterised protein [Mycolicibacterium vanbaalenii]
MPISVITKVVAAPADALWAILADFGDVSWIPIAGQVEVIGSGIGMRRCIHGSGPVPVVEKLTGLQPEKMTLSYTITDNPLPVSRFEATVTVNEEIGDDERPSLSRIAWTVDFDPVGDSEADARAARDAVEAVYEMMAGWLTEAATDDCNRD